MGSNPVGSFEIALSSARERAEALGPLLDAYRSYLEVLARVQIGRRLQQKADPSDLVQDTFLEAHRHFDGFRGTTERALMSWLRQILATQLAELVRRYHGTRTRDVTQEQSLEQELDQSSGLLDRGLADSGDSPSGQAERREQAVIVADALGRLPPDYRDVIVLRQLEGLAFDAVATRMERTVDSVQKLWVRALDRLRRDLTAGG